MKEQNDTRTVLLTLLCVLASLVLSGLRFVLRIDFIDQQTGFYNTFSNISVVFNVLYFSFLAVAAVLAFRAPATGYAARPDRLLGGCAALLGAATLFQAAWDGWSAHGTVAVRTADVFLRWATLAFSLAAGAVTLALAAGLWAGRAPRAATSGALAITVLHRCFLLLESFTRHTTTIAVSADVLETLLLVCGVLFFVSHARVLRGAGGTRMAAFSAAGYVATCAALLVPDLLAAALGRIALPGSCAGRLVQAVCTAAYALAFLARVLRPTAPEPYTRRRG